MDWNRLIEEGAVRAFLSEDIGHLARPIREALVVFLSGLPEAAQHAILARQAGLPANAASAVRLRALAQSCPVLHKLGQALARDRRLDAGLRRELGTLEVMPPSLPLETVRASLNDELGDLAGLGIELEPGAIAEASVAVVIGYRDRTAAGVFKVLKPGIEERLEIELELLEQVGRYLDERCAELGIPRFGYREAFRQVRDKLLDEVRLTTEQAHLALAGRQFARDAGIEVPALRPYCTERVTAMERIRGAKVTDHGLRTTEARSRLASLIASALLVRPVFSRGEEVIFHGDPHAGNLVLTPEGRLAILDWSLAGTLGPRQREAIVHVLVGAMMLDARRVAEMVAASAEGEARDPAALIAIVEDHLRPIRAGRLPDFRWMLGLMDAAFERGGLRASSDLLLLRKSLHTLEGVLADIAPEQRPIEAAFFVDFLQHLTAEWPQRWFAAFDSRAFTTRLSNLDLMELSLALPLATTRFWMGLGIAPDAAAETPGNEGRHS